MVWPTRPRFVLFGSSIVQWSLDNGGWGAILGHLYSRKADIIIRGYTGWNSRQAVQVLDQVFPKGEAIQPSLVIVYFGGNDSVRPLPDGSGSHVPLPEYLDNMRKIANHLKSLSDKTRIIFLTSPPVNETQMLEMLGVEGRTNERSQKYADACAKLCREMGIEVINLCVALKKQDDWINTCFTDGIHLTAVASKIVAEEIQKILKETDWKPNLHFESLATEFA